MRPHPLGARRHAAATHAVARDHQSASREEQVRRAQDAVDRGLAGAVAVVEEVLRVRVVDGDDGEREHPLLLHRAEADHTRRRFLGPADDVSEEGLALAVELRDEVGAVVHRELGPRGEHRFDVPVVALVVLALMGVDGDLVDVHERRRRLVLGREGVRGAERDLGATGLEREHQHGRLGRHVQARAEADPLQRLFLREPLADLAQDRHGLLGPLDAQTTRRRQREVFHVVRCHRMRSFRVDGTRARAPGDVRPDAPGARGAAAAATLRRRRGGPSPGPCAPR